MAKKKNKNLSDVENPVDQPNESAGTGLTASEEKVVDVNPLQVPDEAAAPASESLIAAEAESPESASEDAINDLRHSLNEDKSSPSNDEQKKTDEVKPESIEDIRRSLKEDEQQKRNASWTQRFSNWRARTFPAKPQKSKDDAGLNARLDNKLPQQPKPVPGQSNIDEEYVEEFLTELDTLAKTDVESQKTDTVAKDETETKPATELVSNVVESDVTPPIVEEVPSVAKTSREVLSKSRDEEQSAEQYQNLRSAALEDYDTSPAQPETKIPVRENIRRTLRDLRPADKRWLAAGAVVVVAIFLVLGASAIITNLPEKTTPTTTAGIETPFPSAIRLPGGWDFYLGKGKLQNGKWSPQGAEWLEGTEVSRWVSLPWSLQLEAVLRTLKAGDVIELVMNNGDHLIYKVQSIQKVSVDQITSFDKNVPSLLVILSNKDSNERLVVTAVP